MNMKIHKIRETNTDVISNTVFERIAATIAQPASCFVGFMLEHSLHTIDGINNGDIVCFGAYYALITDNGIFPFQIGLFWKNLTSELAIWNNIIFKCNVPKPIWLDSNCIEIDGDVIHFYSRKGDELMTFEIVATLPKCHDISQIKWTPKD